jgi:hypothetical protein
MVRQFMLQPDLFKMHCLDIKNNLIIIHSKIDYFLFNVIFYLQSKLIH